MIRAPFPNGSIIRLAGTLLVVLTALLLLDNFQYLFHTNLYEFDDLTVNSLQIHRAKSFHELYGQYSRWGFHHPGPAFFYVQAWGELVFHDWWHVVPQPLNAQMLATGLLNVFFLSVALATAAQWVGPRTVFLPLALGLGLLHLAAVQFPGFALGALLLLGNWPGYFLVVPFAALLITLPSVAAGRGESLPFAALTGCFLVHGHISQPALFVLPFSGLAYLGLIRACGQASAPEPPGGKRWFWAALARPWRIFPRAHAWTALIVVVFVFPLLLDAWRGPQSNFARILAFRHEHAGEPHKTLGQSLLYLLQFGTYRWYSPNQDYLGELSAHGVWKYLKANRALCEFWLVGSLGSLGVMATWRRRSPAAAPPGNAAGLDQTAARRLYTRWLAGFTAAAVGMTLVWGCIMNGAMVYYNAFIDFAIFYAALLVMAAVAADGFAAVSAPGWNLRWVQGSLYAVLALLAVLNADRFRPGHYADNAGLGLIGQNVAAALRDEPAQPSARFLDLPAADWTLAINVALQLERQGRPYLAAREWAITFGEDHCPTNPLGSWRQADPLPFKVWKILSAVPPAGEATLPLVANYRLRVVPGTLNPATGGEIRFGGPAANAWDYTAVGWCPPEGNGAPYRWSGGTQSLLQLRAAPIPAGDRVRMRVECIPLLIPGQRDAQQVGLNFNGTELGEWRRTNGEPFEVIIPASVWNARAEAVLRWRFPDAASPAALGLNPDPRVLSCGFQRITFQLEATDPPAIP